MQEALDLSFDRLLMMMIYSPFYFFSSKCSLFHNSNVFGSCIIHILYTGCAKIKNNSGAKRLTYVRLQVKCPLVLSDIKSKFKFLDRFSKYPHTPIIHKSYPNHTQIRAVTADLFQAYGRTDRQAGRHT